MTCRVFTSIFGIDPTKIFTKSCQQLSTNYAGDQLQPPRKACCKSLPPDEASAGPTSPTAAGSGLGAVRALQAEVPDPFSGPTEEERAAILAEMEACRLKAREEMEAQAAANAADPLPLPLQGLTGKNFDAARAEIAMRDDLSQTEKWAAMGMF